MAPIVQMQLHKNELFRLNGWIGLELQIPNEFIHTLLFLAVKMQADSFY